MVFIKSAWLHSHLSIQYAYQALEYGKTVQIQMVISFIEKAWFNDISFPLKFRCRTTKFHVF